MKIKIKYFSIWTFFIISLILICYVIILKDWISGFDKKLTFFLASFAIVFSIFQYLLRNAIDKVRYISQLRIEEYRQIRLIIQDFINVVNTGLSENVSLVETESKLLNVRNELAVLIKSNNSVLFPELMNQNSSKSLDEIYEKILLETSKARKEYQKLKDSESIASESVAEVIKMNWHHTIKDDFKRSFKIRDDLLKYLQSTIILK